MTATFRFRGPRGVATRPATAGGGELWARNATNAESNDGTVIDAHLMNEVVGNLRRLATALGQAPTVDDDDTLRQAIETYVTAQISGHDHDSRYYTEAEVTALLAVKAPLASPALTGVPTAPTAAPGTNTQQIANTAYVSAAVAAVLNSAPGALDTLDELAAALGDDANFAATITNALALKAPLASPGLTGVPTAPTAAPGTNTTQLSTTAFVAAAVAAAVTGLAALASPAFTGVPTAPTAAPGTNTTQVSTTAFVTAAVAAASGAWSVDGSSNAYRATGKVMIGTTTSLGRLTIQSADNAAYGSLTLLGASDGGRLIIGTNAAAAAYIATLNNVDLHLAAQNASTLGTPAVTVKSSGNVGVGDTAPGYKLDVAGVIRSSTGGFRFPDGTTQTTSAASYQTDTRLGTEAYTDITATSTDYKATTGNVLTGVKSHLDSYSSGAGAQIGRIYYKPLQKQISGSWATVSG